MVQNSGLIEQVENEGVEEVTGPSNPLTIPSMYAMVWLLLLIQTQ